MQLVLEKRAERSNTIALVSPLIAIGLTIVTMSILFAILKKNPISALGVYFIDPLTDSYSLQEIAVKAAPLVLIAIGLSLCYLANAWNIGAEGQFLVGAVAGSWIAVKTQGTDAGHWVLPAMLVLGAAAGALYALIPALCKVRFGASEILTSLMLVYVADLFLDANQPIVATKGRDASETRAFEDRAAQRWPDMPLVVLTDSSSASASEIVAGALQDHDRAVIVGTATYGKGSAQRVFRIDNGALKITTALWYTPSGRSINRPRTPVTDDDDVLPVKSDSAPPRPRFKTDAGRTVLGGGGIVPDIEVPNRVSSPADRAFVVALGASAPKFRDAVVDYAVSAKVAHTLRDSNFTVTPAMRDDLFLRLQARGVTVGRSLYDAANGLVDRAISSQLLRYVFGPQAEFSRTLREDPTMQRAMNLLHGVRTPTELLGRVAVAK